ncbi:hypothetical protein GJV85_09700 [Sulfurimonas aquatica]|uniref:Uncharacterized protein n=1 Tax=Sulfurimonas aquatica TaxID=2672570 RepID=A0A975GD99_9BACT|nr:hypothetical protein [Sulfurimonas aquatica]QSZ42367.1 hypothetical protein GJV85_09700 [Sulfurimonas aquatica]
MDIIILILFYMGVFITWGTEAVGSIIKKIGMISKKNLLSSSFVQSLSILARFGFFLQLLVVSWIVDEKLYLESRGSLALGYTVMVLLSIMIVQKIGPKSLFYLFNLIMNKFNFETHDNANTGDVHISLVAPTITQVSGYLLLYTGGMLPLLIQLAFPEFSARGLAIAGVVNGLSTILLIAINDTKMSMQIHKNGFSKIPDQLYVARYIAISILIIVLIVFNLIFN